MHNLGIRHMFGATLWTMSRTKTAASIGRAVKGHGMHRICSGRLRALEIAVERSGMTRARCIAVDKPLDALEVRIEPEKHRGHNVPEEMKSSTQRRRTSLITVGSVEDLHGAEKSQGSNDIEGNHGNDETYWNTKRYVRKR